MGVTRIDVIAFLTSTMILLTLGCMHVTRTPARAAQSKNNLAQLGKAMKHYEGMGRGNVKPDNWEESLAPYLEEPNEVMTCPNDENGKPSYALHTAVERFGMGDAQRTTIVTSDDRLIDIDVKNCKAGSPVVTGKPIARYSGMVFALMYGGSVRSFEKDEIIPDDNETIVIWWLPYRDHGMICGEVVVIKEKP